MRIRSIATMGSVAVITFVLVQSPARAQSALPLAATTVPSTQLIQPEELKTMLNSTRVVQPLILQVGSRVMFDQAHIPTSEYAGAGSREDGLYLLRDRVKTLAKSRFIVLYCGCCPWNRCPNVGGAYKTLSDLGFTNVKVLYIADNFGSDWVSKGYPVAH
jgi:thiosulfate/3-mercaptopyruvate sulfurtransferase